MKILIVVVLFIFVLGFKTQAQNYQPVYSNRVALFENIDKEVIGLRIDSVKIDSDSILYPFATIQMVSVEEHCYSPYKASWIGEKVEAKADGTNLFFNLDGDTITLKTKSKIGHTWIAFNTNSSITVEASLQTVALETFLGLSDSVKTIAFRVIDQNGKTVEHALNKLKVKISKNYGFVETLNFFLFPDYFTNDPAAVLRNYSLIGLTNPLVGVQNLTWFEVNNFNVGDEIHVQEHNLGDYLLAEYIREYDSRCLYKYLERTDYADSIVYHYARKQSIETTYADSTTLEIYNDTLKSVILANPSFDKLPEEPIFSDNTVYAMHMRNNAGRIKIDPSMLEHYLGTGNCWYLPTGEGCFIEKQYFPALGGPYYYCTGYVGEKKERKLVYYKKGTTEWGTKLSTTVVSTVKTNNQLKVYPNPACDLVTFEMNNTSETHQVCLYSQTGQLVKTMQIKGSAAIINIADLKSGLYLYSLTSSTNPLGITGKLVVN